MPNAVFLYSKTCCEEETASTKLICKLTEWDRAGDLRSLIAMILLRSPICEKQQFALKLIWFHIRRLFANAMS